MTIQENDLDTDDGNTQALTQSDNNTYGFDTGGIVSYVVPTRDTEVNIVDAVTVVAEEKVVKERTKRKRRYLLVGILLFVIIAMVIIVAVVVLVKRRGTIDTGFDPDINSNATNISTQAPTLEATAVTTPLQGMDDFVAVLETYYESPEQASILLSDTLSPQYQAAFWSVESASGIDMSNDRLIQRFALATFYFATNGDEWFRCGRQSTRCDVSQEWLTGVDECSWYAIECDDEGDVVEIYFPPHGESSNNIRGNLPYELSFLSKLAVFIVARGPLTGRFPDWSKLSTLKQVLMNENEFEGPFPTYLLTQNPMLGTIQFDHNNFQGQFLQDLSSLDPMAVEDISVNENNFTGLISSQIGKLASLRHLDIGSNGFSGTLPEELYSLTNLISLNVSDTKLSGEISSSIGSISKLIEIYLANTDMGGNLPTQFFSLNQLRKLDLESAKFTGLLSVSFSNLTNLDFAKLNNNEFIGTIPPGLESLPFLEHLELHANNLGGSVPQELCSRRGDGFMQLQVLTVDCIGEAPKVSCTCCTNCPQGL